MREGSFPTLHIQPRAYGPNRRVCTTNSKMLSLGDLCQSEHSRLTFSTEFGCALCRGHHDLAVDDYGAGLICHASAATFGSGWSSRCLVGQTTGRPRSTELDRHKLSGRVCLPTGPDRLLLGCWPALRVDLRLVAGQRMVCPQAKVERSCQKHRGPKLTAILTLCHARW